MMNSRKMRILLVDDESSLLDVGGQMFEYLGHEVTCRQDGLEALETFRTKPEAFDLVMTDHTMPAATHRFDHRHVPSSAARAVPDRLDAPPIAGGARPGRRMVPPGEENYPREPFRLHDSPVRPARRTASAGQQTGQRT